MDTASGRSYEVLLEAFFCKPERPTSAYEQLAVSIVGALAICSEIAERYQGIVATGLAETITLGRASLKQAAKGDLSILDFRPPYEARQPRDCGLQAVPLHWHQSGLQFSADTGVKAEMVKT